VSNITATQLQNIFYCNQVAIEYTAIELHYYRNSGRTSPAFCKDWIFMAPPSRFSLLEARSVLAWPAWLRVLAVLPAVALLWLAVLWANGALGPW
jgi:hypothetical protein